MNVKRRPTEKQKDTEPVEVVITDIDLDSIGMVELFGLVVKVLIVSVPALVLVMALAAYLLSLLQTVG